MTAKKILIVDDMPDAIEFLPERLRREGFEPLLATRGQQALALAEESRPDIILLDTTMPGMDGIETCRRLRMNPATADIPVMMVSARSPSEARAEAQAAGAVDFITRPIDFANLLVRLQRVFLQREDTPLDQRRLLEEMAYTAVAVLPCSLAWLLVVDPEKRWLVSQSIAMDRGAEAARLFSTQMQSERGTLRFPLVHGDNPLSEVVLNRKVLINVPAERFRQLPGGIMLHRAFTQFRLAYASLLPLVSAGRTVGAMVLGTLDAQATESRRGQQIVNALSSQAAMAIDNVRLMDNLARRDVQMRAEQAFRQMVLDTMGEGLVVVDEGAKITYVNNRLLLITGYSREMLYGRSVGLIFHPSNRDQIVRSLTGQRRDTLSLAQTLYTKDGSEVPVLVSRAVAPSPDGKGNSTVIVVTDLTELHRNEEALKHQTQRLQAINRAANAISSASTFEEVVQVSLQAALQVVDGLSASILLRDQAQKDLFTQVAAIGPHLDAINQRRAKPGEGLAGRIATTAKSQIVTEVKQEAEVFAEYSKLYGAELRSIIAVPLVAFDEVIGVFEVVNKRMGRFDRQDVETLESLAGSAAITIENARLFDQTRRRVTELSTLLDASAAVTSTLDFGDILERIARRLSVALRVERVLILDRERQSDHLVSLAEVVNAYWPLGSGPLHNSEAASLVSTALTSGARVISPPPDSETASPLEEVNPSGLRAAAVFPIALRGHTVGVVALYREARRTTLSPSQINAVSDAITVWETDIGAYDPEDWLSRPNLTDLCQRVLQTSALRWCGVFYRDEQRGGVRLAREIGYALWLTGTDPTIWNTERYPTLGRALGQSQPQTLKREDLPDDPHERDYLQRVGGNTCLLAPLLIRGEPGGLVKLIDSKSEQRSFDEGELSLCQGIANVVGNAMENAHLYTAQERRATALEAAYKELQSADEMKDDLLQNLSHELRTPLTHILGYLRLMLDNAFGELSPEQVDTLTLVTNKAEHLATLVKDIVSVQDASARDMEPKPIHLERVVAQAVRSMASKAQTNEIRIVPRIPTNLPLAYADPVRVGEVFEELLENAIKFSPLSSQIEITLDDPGGLMLHACVHDNGIGIAPEEHEKIFRRFYQVDSGTTRRYAGTGLGLTVVKQVVEGHSGRVWVESDTGKGSSFHLTLPKASAMTDSTSTSTA